ncbi:MAG: hypothetical protein AMS18_01520 [Gemmatimonas sp. SG8_17]|nr:MAG: hypothetical protein AMS18_01520 [Gemmatimonas sp. SG8_17]
MTRGFLKSRSEILAVLSVTLPLFFTGMSRASAENVDIGSSARPDDETHRERFVEEEEEVRAGIGAEEEYRNAIAFGLIYTRSILRPRESATGEPRPEAENLLGLNLVYDRVLIPNHLALAIAKPFLFNPERYDSPLEVVLKALIRRGQWEPFFGLGLHSNLYVFSGEREEQEGKRVEYAIGLLAATGFTFIFTPHWGLELEFAYVYVFNDTSVSQHDISPAVNAVYFFQRGQRRND